MKKIDNAILEEISRYNSINNYIVEQEAELPPPPADAGLPPDPLMGGEVPPADPGAVPPPPAAPDAAAAPPTSGGTEPQPVDVATDPDVEKVGEEKGKTEEIEITDLVKSQKEIEKKQDEYFENLFKHLGDLEGKLGEMDSIVNKLNDLEAKVEKYRVKTPEEKLELRSLDSGPFNQKLSDFFEDKEDEMEKTGKNEYVLTQDEVEDYSPSDIKKTFRNFENLDNTFDNFKQVK